MRFSKFDLKSAKRLLPRRTTVSNKATAGRSLIIAGSRGMFGAAVLSAMASARVGSGYVRLMTDVKAFPSTRHPDFLTLNWSAKISSVASDAIAIGPGLGQAARAHRLLRELMRDRPTAVVLDADALTMLAKLRASGKSAAHLSKVLVPATWVVTPHDGELSRLLGVSSNVIRRDRRKAVMQAQRLLGCVVLLKGHRTLVASANRCFEIQSGNAALAKAGTGDVLTGMITGFMAQGLSSLDAACLGAYLHGFVADEWLRSKRDVLSLMASDIIERLPMVLARVRGPTRKRA